MTEILFTYRCSCGSTGIPRSTRQEANEYYQAHVKHRTARPKPRKRKKRSFNSLAPPPKPRVREKPEDHIGMILVLQVMETTKPEAGVPSP
jgi:hypothetical protein